MSELRHLRVPSGRIYELHDVFTRIDEELAEIIKGLDQIITLLHEIIKLMAAQQPTLARAREVIVYRPAPQPQQPQQPAPAPVIPPVTPAPTQETIREVVTERVLLLPGVTSISTYDAVAQPDRYREVRLYGRTVVVTPDDDILVAGRPDAPGFPLRAGVYMVINRAEELTSVYIKSAVNTPVTVHFMILQVEGVKQ